MTGNKLEIAKRAHEMQRLAPCKRKRIVLKYDCVFERYASD